MIQARIRKAWPSARGFSLDVELRASEGVTVLFGPRGAGKTTALEVIAGLVRPDEGRILIDDQILFDGGTRVNLPPRARPCGYVLRDYALFPHMTLRQNLVFAATCRRLPRLERHRRVNETLERFGLTEVAASQPREVSAAVRARCAVAQALVSRPKALLLDEPSHGLDAASRAEFHGLLRQARSDFGFALLAATPDLDECLELGDEMQVLAAGRVVQAGKPCQVVEQPATAGVAAMLGNFNLLPVEITALDPVRKTSRFRLGQLELTGPYFPGRFRGDRVTLCVRRDELLALPASGKPGANQVPLELLHATEKPQGASLQFTGGIVADLPRGDWEQRKHNREWVVEFPAQSLRVL
jgi:ABC-type sulfate/molybdate transport systems ATPase subunit